MPVDLTQFNGPQPILLLDHNGNAFLYQDGQLLPASIEGVSLLASDGTRLHAISSDANGKLNVNSTVSNFPATQAVSAASLPLPVGAATDVSLTNGNLRGVVSVGNFPAVQGTLEVKASSSVVSTVAASASTQTAMAANANRMGAVIFNNQITVPTNQAWLYVKFGSGASSVSFTYAIAPNGTLEIPHPSYSGLITVAFSVANGSAQITELGP